MASKILKLIYVTLFFLCTTYTVKGQVEEVKYLLKYDTASCQYIVCVVAVKGSASATNQLIQLNSQISLVTVTGHTLTIDSLIGPRNYLNGLPLSWGITVTREAPAADPSSNFYAITTPTGGLSNYRYSPITEGDTIPLFRVKTTAPANNCEPNIRLWRNNFIQNNLVAVWAPGSTTTDPPSSAAGMNSGDFDNGFVLGPSNNQLYYGNLEPEGPPQPNLEYGGLVCEESGTLSIDIQPDTTNCMKSYTYEWDGPGLSNYTGQDVVIPNAGIGDVGTYYVTITDGNGCKDTLSYDAEPKPNAGTDMVLCGGGDVVLTADSPVFGNWIVDPNSSTSGISLGSTNGLEATVTFDPTASGTYTFIYEANLCSDTIEINMTGAAPAPTASYNGPVCEGEDITFSGPVLASGGTYTWLDPFGVPFGGNTQNPTLSTVDISMAGTYTLVVEENGCTSLPATIDVVVNSKPTVDPGFYAPVCESDSPITLSGTPTGGVYTYNNDPITTFDPAIGGGIYDITYTVTDSNGCSNSGITSIEVFNVTAVDAGTYNDICENDFAITLFGNPSGGNFIYDNNVLIGDQFDPSVVGQGNHKVYYEYSDGNGCISIDSTIINVKAIPLLDPGTYVPLCKNEDALNLSGSPAGGSFYDVLSNDPISIFDPKQYGPGLHDIRFEATSSNGCSAEMIFVIEVYDVIDAEGGNYGPYCKNDDPKLLVGTPSSGVFTYNNTVITEINPTLLNVGTNEIIYSVTDANNCIDVDTFYVEINDLPTLDPGIFAPVCVDASPFTLTGTPANGTYSGPGVTTNEFDPGASNVIIGVNTVTFMATDANGCSDETTVDITVNDLPQVDAGTYAEVCIDNGNVSLSGNVTGTWSGNSGITGNEFNPSIVGAGPHNIILQHTDANGCQNADTAIIIVNALPVVDAGSYPPLCANASAITLAGTPVSGTFSWPGGSGTTFSPSIGAGDYIITYDFTDVNGCFNSDTTTIRVYDLPTLVAGTYGPYCKDANPVNLVGIPASGTYSGPGVVSNVFNPAATAVAIGTNTLTFMATDANGCSNSTSFSISVNDLPSVDAGVYTPICIDNGTLNLSGNVAGIWSGNVGISGSVFDPSVAGAGLHDIILTYIDGNGCSNADTTTITVNELPVVNAGTYAPLCVDAAPINLAGTPSGGTYLGSGVAGSIFDPSIATPGIHTIVYEYTDMNGCTNTASTDITVYDLPSLDPGVYGPYCKDASPITLSGIPVNGTFSGPGVSGNTFDPTETSVMEGTNTLTFLASDANGCSNSMTFDIVVNALPIVDAGTYNAICINNGTIQLIGNVPGTWSGNSGIAGDIFDPTAVGQGTWDIILNYVDNNGCIGSDQTNITVNELPNVSINTYDPVCENEDAFTIMASPAGGVFTGAGTNLMTGLFTPSLAMSGIHEITYEVTDAIGCSNSTTTFITVNEVPQISAGTWGPYCEDAGTITLSGSPSNGQFTGDDVSGNIFDANTAGPGQHQVTFSYTSTAGCYNEEVFDITVFALPTVTIDPIAPLCKSDGIISIGVSPSTAELSGEGVDAVAMTFDPSVGAGIYTVRADFVDNNGCANFDTYDIEVNDVAFLDPGNYGPYCINEDKVQLQSNPSGAVYMGDGVNSSYEFDPKLAGAGSHQITVTYTDQNGCTTTDMIEILVNEVPTVDVGVWGPYCKDAGVITLSGTPVGGNFSGSNVFDFNKIDAATFDEGTYEFYYDYTDSNTGCSSIDTFEIQFFDIPNITLDGDQSVCVNEGAITLNASPLNGVWSGDYVNPTTGEFNPALSNDGTFTLTYTVTNVNQCTNSEDIRVTVYPKPTFDPGSYDDLCVNSPSVNLVSIPVGAVYQVGAVTTTTFDPSTSGLGPIAVTAIFTDNNNCIDTQIVNITVNDIPSITITNNSPICEGSNITVSADGGNQYNWNGPSITNFAGASININNAGTSDAGTYQVLVTDTNGCSNSASTVIVVNAAPSFDIASTQCTPDLQNYTVTYTSNATVNASAGNVDASNGMINDIPKDTDISVYLSTADGCLDTVSISAPNCDCPSIAKPILVKNEEVCAGLDVPALKVSVPAGITVDWYSTMTGGTPIAVGVDSLITGETIVGNYIYYAEARSVVDNCISATRTKVELTILPVSQITNTILNQEICSGDSTTGIVFTSDNPSTGFNWTTTITGGITGVPTNGIGNVPSRVLTAVNGGSVNYTVTPSLGGCMGDPVTFAIQVNPLPSLDIINVACAPDLLTYSIEFTTNGEVMYNGNLVSGNMITGIDISTRAVLEASIASTGCIRDVTIDPPNCSCPDIAAPVKIEDETICKGELIPDLNATVDAGLIVRWFDSPTGGNLLATGTSYVPTVADAGLYTYYAEALNPIDSCKSDNRTPVSLTISEVGQLTNTQFTDELCLGEMFLGFTFNGDQPNMTYAWTSSVVGLSGIPSSGSGDVVSQLFNEAGSVTYMVTPILGQCEGEAREFTLNVNDKPSLSISSVKCAPDLSTYEITFVSTAEVIYNSSVVSGGSITGIARSENTTLYLTDLASGCKDTIVVNAPQCNCPTIAPPTNPMDALVCQNEANPAISVDVPAGYEVRWYTDSTGGAPIGSTNTYTSMENEPGTYLYYAETFSPTDNCTSDSRVEVTFTINPAPSFDVLGTDCSIDFSSYSINFYTDGTFTPQYGTINGNLIEGVPANQNEKFIVTIPSTGCELEVTVDAPECNCPDVPQPSKVSDLLICEGDIIPSLEVIVGIGVEVYWYDSALGTIPIDTGAIFTPIAPVVGVNSYYAEAINIVDGCVSELRTEVQLIVSEAPTFEVLSKQCTSDLNFYTIQFNTTGTVTVDFGDINGNTIENIPANQNIKVTITSQDLNCTDEVDIVAPNCNCGVVDMPTSPMNAEVCFMSAAMPIGATVPSGFTIDWYGSASGSDLLLAASNSYIPNVTNVGTYTYYAEARSELDGCVSNTRVAVRYTIKSLPDAGSVADVVCYKTDNGFLNAITPGGFWALESGPGMVTLSGMVSQNQIASDFTASGVYTFVYTVNGCTDQVVMNVGQNCACDITDNTIGQPTNALFCNISSSITIVGSNAAPSGGNYTWIYLKDGVMTNVNTPANQKDLTVNNLGIGRHEYYRIYTTTSFPICSDTSNTVLIEVLDHDAGNDQVGDCVVLADYSIGATARGVGEWSQSQSNPSIVNISDVQDPNAVFDRFSAVGTYEFSWANSICSDVFTVIVKESVDAGLDVNLECYKDASARLNALGVGGIWTAKPGNPTTVTIEDANAAETEIVGFGSAGIYTFVWSKDGCEDEVSVVIADNCPCDVSDNLIVPPFDSVYCNETGLIRLIGVEAKPEGGNYLWIISKDGGSFEAMPIPNNQKDYTVSNLKGGSYKIARIYETIGTNTCSDTSNFINLSVYTEELTPGDISIDPYPVCVGDTVSLFVEEELGISYTWSILSGGGRLLLGEGPMAMIYAESPGVVSLAVRQRYDVCQSSTLSDPSTFEFMINANPVPFLGLDTTYCQLEEEEGGHVLYAGEYEDYEWQDGSSDKIFDVQEKGLYSVTVTDENGCVGEDFIEIKEYCCEFLSPNIMKFEGYTNGSNSQFSITDKYLCAIESELTIFDRWGNVVFRSDDGINAIWDGTFNGKPVEQGVYVFHLSYTGLDENNQEFDETYSGDITVIR